MRRAALLVAMALSLAGCSGGQAPRPARPDENVAIPVLLARADSSAARGARAEARDEYARAAQKAKHEGARDLEYRAELNGGLLSIDLGEPDPARRSLARAAELRPQSAEAHDALGLLHTATRRYMDAKAEFDRAAALDTVSAIPLYHLGVAYAQSGDQAKAAEAFSRALARDPTHAPTLAALGSTLDSRYRAAGLPEDYPALRAHPSVSRGELGVMLAAELGADPARPSWRGRSDRPSDTEEARGAWGEPWLRVSIARGWITPFPDGSFHLADPVTRGMLALLVTGIAGRASSPATNVFPDLTRRHYLFRAASEATSIGMPLRGMRFEPSASVTGPEALQTLKGLAARLGVEPVVGGEQRPGGVVK
ncbi:MAG TPA: tetratricopeptide repeat protein [Candidatus Saccharimonadales bacterium]|nr:tetratricopeptide repeat protein [Candidatus Saccharimonadales bacterium]